MFVSQHIPFGSDGLGQAEALRTEGFKDLEIAQTFAAAALYSGPIPEGGTISAKPTSEIASAIDRAPREACHLIGSRRGIVASVAKVSVAEIIDAKSASPEQRR